ncbi:unnamed protein product [Clavelina lepadiformis]|uniref:Uncharacterized protein n=1 Tax=Clavelina lepadiformis TaxID=159417 RepID=A0ABP0FBG3_CLALP
MREQQENPIPAFGSMQQVKSVENDSSVPVHYLQRFEHHVKIYNVMFEDKRKLVCWHGLVRKPMRLYGKLSLNFNVTVICNQSHADWTATLCGIARDCRFACKSDQCNHLNYVDVYDDATTLLTQCLIESSNRGMVIFRTL